jgi:hypothetical protein
MVESTSEAVGGGGVSARLACNKSWESTIRDLLEADGENVLIMIGKNPYIYWGGCDPGWETEDGPAEDGGACGDTVDSSTGVWSR